jgi:uncharacterized lipoprotein YajG
MNRGIRCGRVALAVAILLLAACQSTPPVAPQSDATTLGDWTVSTGGYVRVESGVVH